MKIMRALLLGVAATGAALAQTAPTAQHMPRGTATDISNAEILATVQRTASAPVSDQQIRVVNVNGEYNVGVGVASDNTYSTGSPGLVSLGGETVFTDLYITSGS